MSLRSSFLSGVCVSGCLVLGACSLFHHKDDAPAPETDVSSIPPAKSDLEAENARLTKRLEAMEEKMALMNDKLSAERTSLDNVERAQNPNPKTKSVAAPIQDQAGETTSTADERDETPSNDFTHGDAIEKYRSAMILFDSGKYPEATLEFTNFIRSYPDNPFSGGAQFFIGESYYKQGEIKLAVDEYQRVLATFDHSSYVTDALKRLAQCYDKLKQPKLAARNRQLLLSLFPQSPAAKEILEARAEPAALAQPAMPSQGLAPAQAPVQNSGIAPAQPAAPALQQIKKPAIEPGTEAGADAANPAVIPTAPVGAQ
jgi:tol-pal system protein YbgF